MKNITFITGTRADYGKIKSLVIELQKKRSKFKTNLIITGMHNVKNYGNTKDEIDKDKIKNCYRFNNQSQNKNMDIIDVGKSSTVYHNNLTSAAVTTVKILLCQVYRDFHVQ